MDPQSWIISCLKIFKISDEVVNFIKKAELTELGRSLAEAKVQRGIFQEELSAIIVMMPLNHILRKYTAGYNLGKEIEGN